MFTGEATLIDFGVAKHASVPDQFPAARYGTPGYQAPELLMTDMRAAERDQKLYQKVDTFAMGKFIFIFVWVWSIGLIGLTSCFCNRVYAVLPVRRSRAVRVVGR